MYLFTKPKIFRLVIANIMKLYPTLKKINLDLVIAGHSGWILQLSFIISRIFKIKIISIAYGLDLLVRNILSFRTYYFRNADKIILITHQTKELIKKIHHLNEDKLEVIYVGVDTESLKVKETKLELRKEFNIPTNEFVILSVGRHIPRKNFQLVLKALNKINKLSFYYDAFLNRFVSIKYINHYKIKYYLIGEGEETVVLKRLTEDLNLKNQVVFLGRCDINTRNKYYKMADLFIMPSITKKDDIEGFGIVFLEANYFKVPVIGTATGGMSEAIVNRKTGFLIKQNDTYDLVNKIIFLYNNEAKRKEMGENGFNRVITNFRWENIIRNYINLFNKLK